MRLIAPKGKFVSALPSVILSTLGPGLAKSAVIEVSFEC